eukprot:NODE_1389_length_1756_cov_43.917942_g1320_i0.p1 GENE.NODE_1389_length_1756_cov_43.917942_g1320_i0~~NODE_1389_length_1756_cov_43.917942_g1320_i0.p1  ORF type:complete len:409 (+),score=105.25 NODE_1389_length_1756_cov_43.917942_g1320_i0:398-1624(+)
MQAVDQRRKLLAERRVSLQNLKERLQTNWQQKPATHTNHDHARVIEDDGPATASPEPPATDEPPSAVPTLPTPSPRQSPSLDSAANSPLQPFDVEVAVPDDAVDVASETRQSTPPPAYEDDEDIFIEDTTGFDEDITTACKQTPEPVSECEVEDEDEDLFVDTAGFDEDPTIERLPTPESECEDVAVEESDGVSMDASGSEQEIPQEEIPQSPQEPLECEDVVAEESDGVSVDADDYIEQEVQQSPAELLARLRSIQKVTSFSSMPMGAAEQEIAQETKPKKVKKRKKRHTIEEPSPALHSLEPPECEDAADAESDLFFVDPTGSTGQDIQQEPKPKKGKKGKKKKHRVIEEPGSAPSPSELKRKKRTKKSKVKVAAKETELLPSTHQSVTFDEALAALKTRKQKKLL